MSPQLPPFPDLGLAKAPVHEMNSPTLNPANFNAEALLAAHHEQLRAMEKSLDQLKLAHEKLADKIAALGWKVLWALVGIALDLLFRGGEMLKH